MKTGKSICNELKKVRRRIAEENGIPFEVPECTYKGECLGTCPRCEAEVKYLEQELHRRMTLGKAAAVAGVAMTLAAFTSCATEGDPWPLEGDVYTPEDTTDVDTTSDATHSDKYQTIEYQS